MVRDLVVKELRIPNAQVRCPGLAGIGEAVVCEVAKDGRRLKVLRSANSHIEVEAVP
jgi:hypothetical protein